jgi:hypothetical protein
MLFDATYAQIGLSAAPGNLTETIQTAELPAGRYYVGIMRTMWSLSCEYTLVARFSARPTPTPTPTLAPPFFVDGFSDPNSGWGSVTYSDFDAGYAGGEYVIRVKEPGRLGFRWGPEVLVLSNGRVEVEAHAAEGSSGAYGFLLGRPDGQVYAFLISPSGWYEVLYYDSLIHAPVAFLPWTRAGAVLEGSATNRIEVGVVAGVVSLRVNGAELPVPETISSLAPMRAGLAVDSFQTVPAEAHFDNVRATLGLE